MPAKRSLFAVVVLSVAAAVSVGALRLLPLADAALAEPPKESENAARNEEGPVKVLGWKDDPVCQMVFFAVLEGLYIDGVPSDVVNSLVPPSKKGDDNAVKANFVAQCPLCHPVYEALSLYQRRGAFQDSAGKRNTFGQGLDRELQQRLTSESRKERLTALRVLVRRCVERRMTMMRLSEKERNEWITKLTARSQQGRKLLLGLIQNDPKYGKDWSVYWGCAACNGTTDACQTLRSRVEGK